VRTCECSYCRRSVHKILAEQGIDQPKYAIIERDAESGNSKCCTCYLPHAPSVEHQNLANCIRSDGISSDGTFVHSDSEKVAALYVVTKDKMHNNSLPIFLSRYSHPDIPVPISLSLYSHPDIPVPIFPSRYSCPDIPLPILLSRFIGPDISVPIFGICERLYTYIGNCLDRNRSLWSYSSPN